MVAASIRHCGAGRRLAALGLALALPIAAHAQSDYANGGAGNPGIAPDYSTDFTQELLFSPVFTSPIQQLFSAPDDFSNVEATDQPPFTLADTDTTLTSALLTQDMAAMPAYGPSLADPIAHHPSPAGATPESMASYFCLTQAQQNAQIDRYWSFVAPAEPEAGNLPGFSVFQSPDRQAANDPADTNAQWCGANLPKPWAVEPFPLDVWGVLLVLSLGIFLFWAARGFKSP